MCFSIREHKEINYAKSSRLRYFDQKLDKKLSVDASKSGLGAVLLRKHENKWFSVAYASWAMTSSEKNYAQIEKETLAIGFGTDRFHDYFGMENSLQ